MIEPEIIFSYFNDESKAFTWLDQNQPNKNMGIVLRGCESTTFKSEKNTKI